MDRPIAPIFNINKRPRQALVSDPFDSQPANSTSGCPSASPGARPSPQSRPWNQVRPNPTQMTGLLPPKPSLPQYQQKQRNPQPGRNAQGTVHTEQGNYSRGANSATKSAFQGGPAKGQFGQVGSTKFQSSNPFNTMQTNTVKLNAQPSPPSRSSIGFKGNNSRNFNQKRGYQQSGQGNFNPQTGINQPNSHTFSNINQPNSNSITPQKRFNTQTYNRSQLPGHTQKPHSGSSPQPSTSFASAPLNKKKQFGNNKQETDKTLRVLTATVQSVKQWGYASHSVPVLFEVHGIVNSAITTSRITQGKEFLLKDETGVVPCVFFEIDRRLDRVTRGQWYRCMGTFDRRLAKLKCVSVRVSSPAERNLAEIASKLSDQTLRDLVRDLRET